MTTATPPPNWRADRAFCVHARRRWETDYNLAHAMRPGEQGFPVRAYDKGASQRLHHRWEGYRHADRTNGTLMVVTAMFVMAGFSCAVMS